MWDYLKKYKNNHTTSSLPQTTRSNASPDKRIWMTGPPTLNPLNWHCFRFALGHHLFQHPLSPYDEQNAQDVAKLLPRMKEQASTATTATHPLFMTPFTPEELKHEIKKLHPDKSPGPSGITNRMLQAGDIDFQGLILIFFNGLWEFHTQPSDWQLSLLQPIYKGHNKDKTDPASYRGIYLNDTLAKLFEGLLISRLTTHTELLNTLTHNQLGTKPDTQTHDAIYSLFALIQHNKYTLDKPTYVAFIDYSTAYPSVHRDGLSSALLKNDIRGNMWHHLRARFDKIKLRVLHPGISAHHTVDILRGLPEGSRLSPTLFGIFVADLVHELRTKFPHAVIHLGHSPPHPHTLRSRSTTHIWIGGLLYVDDLALLSTCPRELQSMLHACQHWSTRNRMQINTEKTKIMAFFETPALLRARGGQHQPSPTMPPFHVYSPFPISDPRSYPILEVSQFEYLGLILDPKLTMHLATVEAIRRASQGQALALAVSYSLRYDKNSSQLTPTQNLGLWKSIVLPHFLQNLRYIHSDTDIKKMQTSLNLSLARVLHVYGNHTGLLAETGIPPLQLTRYVHLAQLHFRLTTTRPDTLPALLLTN
jgi:hypothetical protein